MAEGDTLTSMILLALVFLLMLGFVYLILPPTKSAASNIMCQASAFAMAKTKVLGVESPIISDLKCETQYVKVKEDGIYRYDDGKYKKDPLYRNFKDKNKKEYSIQKAVADEMHQCWKYLGRGKIDPFGKYDGSAKCVICSQIEFDKETSEKYPKFEKFGEFLQENYVTDEETGAQTSYWSYLTGGAEGDIDVDLTTEPVSITFISIKPDEKFNVGASAIAGGVVAEGCEGLPEGLMQAGKFLRNVPIAAGRFSTPLRIGARIAGFSSTVTGAVPFGLVCKAPLIGKLAKSGLAKKGLFIAGTAFFVTNANGDVEPRVVIVTPVPTAQIGTECDKLY